GDAAVAPIFTVPVGKTFSQWNVSFSNVMSALTVVAQYEDVTYTVSFDLAGGEHTGGGALSQTVTHGGSATAPNLTAPVGQTFSQWSAAFDSVTSALAITAVYTDNFYSVNFDLAGGDHTGGGALSQSVLQNR